MVIFNKTWEEATQIFVVFVLQVCNIARLHSVDHI